MNYCHTQKAPLFLILLAGAALAAIIAGCQPPQSPDRQGLLLVAVSVALIALCFGTLTVRDAGEKLVVRFGPIPLFGKSIRYADIRQVEAARSSFSDGWGIHYCPGRGWIYNLWGFDCVRIRFDRKTVRIGTDDPQGLVEFLRSKLTDEA